MKTKSIVFLLFVLFYSCSKTEQKTNETEIIVIGTQHKPVPNFDSEILFDILEKVKPDLILLELDSIKFTSDFQIKEVRENELIAAEKYRLKYPTTLLRPFEFEGRNQYRIDHGMRPTYGLTLRFVDSLFKADLLTTSEAEIFKAYQDALNPLIEIAAKDPKEWNNAIADSLCEHRQYYQYQMIQKITNVRKEFADKFITKPNGEKISYRDGYHLWANFWDLRNQTMAKNIMTISEENKGKRIVVLCGFMHRYYILEELQKRTENKNIVLKEYYAL